MSGYLTPTDILDRLNDGVALGLQRPALDRQYLWTNSDRMAAAWRKIFPGVTIFLRGVIYNPPPEEDRG